MLTGGSKGYATLDYEDAGWRESKLAKIQLLVNKQPVDAICRVVHGSQADRIGRQWVTKFRQHVDRQMFGTLLYRLARPSLPRLTTNRGRYPSSSRQQDYSPRNNQALPQGRPRQTARQRHHAAEEAAREAKGRSKEATSRRQCRHRPGGISELPVKVMHLYCSNLL